ncbi:RNA-directed DNA polymerase from mobile element jockey-like [Brachionus plicatilis]|uniref:RNA-directed DNA polymerase from mobile element jockey-like n=1 Tax=Brachionus plicatilis TaxID=10195 RepID=A0A3M7SK53_BRAPC|nr:RNA-directed DNA polymerase from mobile element jockey-like [Brachionus plicatilis]
MDPKRASNSTGVSVGDTSTRSTEPRRRYSYRVFCSTPLAKHNPSFPNAPLPKPTSNPTSIPNSPLIRCLYTNATSLNNKWDELKARLITENYPHLLLITETWFTNNSITNLDNYTLFRKHRSYSSVGGVAIYARDEILTVEANHIIKPASSSEQIWCSIITPCRESIPVGCL